jgi:hypothetical protein
MDELINTISQKTGLQPEQAKAAANAVLEFLKARLPLRWPAAWTASCPGEPAPRQGRKLHDWKGPIEMKSSILKLFTTSSALAVALTLSGAALAFQAAPQQAPAKTQTPAKTQAPAKAPRAAAAPAPSAQEIADAQSKGLVWVNVATKVYHKDGQFYGKTKQGKFMTEADAQKAGYRSAKESPIGKKKTSDKK